MTPEIINLIFPQNLNLPTPKELEKKYPKRDLPEGAVVTRQGPSPTGFAHLGLLYASLASRKIVDSSSRGGCFYLRIEDTDKEREVENGISILVTALKDFDIKIDEGPIEPNQNEVGSYGPYIQSQRSNIYQAFVKKLLEEDKAYLCFCSKEELDEIRKIQTEQKLVPGYYGKWAKWRNMADTEILAELKKGNQYVIRFKATTDENKKITVNDAINGEISFPTNILEDFVILKPNRLPTYHFAHVIDDHLMRTTLVLRSTEWISSLPKHIQLFEALNFEIPTYAHIAPIEKMVGSTRRKLSKRKDREANVNEFLILGYEPEAVKAYLLNLLTPKYDEYILNQNFVYDPNFNLTVDMLKGGSGALFDQVKLDNYSANYIAGLTAKEVYDKAFRWSKKYKEEKLNGLTEQASILHKILTTNKNYAIKVFNIERATKNPRKDISKWSDINDSIGFMFDEIYNKLKLDKSAIEKNDSGLIEKILKEVQQSYDTNDTKEVWLEKIKFIATENNFAIDRKEYKNNLDKYNGFWAEIPAMVRVALAKKNQAPDLYEIMQVLGKEKLEIRFADLIRHL